MVNMCERNIRGLGRRTLGAPSESGRGPPVQGIAANLRRPGTCRDGVGGRDLCCVMRLEQQTQVGLLHQLHDATRVSDTYAIPTCPGHRRLAAMLFSGAAPSRLRRRRRPKTAATSPSSKDGGDFTRRGYLAMKPDLRAELIDRSQN